MVSSLYLSCYTTHMTEAFIKHALANGDEGKKWLDSIPDLIKEYEEKWDLKVQSPFNLNYNYVAPATRADGSDAVLKIGFPKDEEFQTEMRALEIFNGEGIAPLLAEDRDNGVILIERVQPGTTLEFMEDDQEATRIMVSVMKKLWKPLPVDHKFITIESWTKDLFQLREWYNGTTGPLPEYLIDKAQALFKDLISSQGEQMLLHGDFHHNNVLFSDKHGWMAIDPKGIAGEPCYETAAMLRNPYSTLLKRPHPEQVLKRRIQILSEELGFDAQRIHQWGIAQTVLSAVWSTDEKGKGWEHEIAVVEILDKIKL